MEKEVLLSEEITKQLLNEIKNGRYKHEKKLPPEISLAKEMDVSRTLIRDCLITLEREGFITRKHGVGTIINHHILKACTRMDLEEEFLDMVKNAGYKPEMRSGDASLVLADEEIASKLNIEIGEKVFKVGRIVMADDKPAIFCIDHVPLSCVVEENYDITLLKKPVFLFIEQYCQEEVYMDMTEVKAILAPPYVEDILKIQRGTPVLYMDEIGYTIVGKPILYSKEYYVNDILHHYVMRKKI